MKPISSIWLAGLLSAWTIAAGAQAQDQVNPPPATTTQAETRIVNSFSTWAGSEEYARSLVTGLRQGSEITAPTPTPTPTTGGAGGTGTAGGAGTTSIADGTFTPPTRPMGYGNVRIALSLAREQLAQSGITEPTPAQIETALMGGTITTTTSGTGTGGATTTSTQFQGVLQMRADGMGWGQIANSMGVKLGHVMSGRTSVPPPAPTTTGTAQTGSGTGASTGSGITTASGTTSSTTTTQGRGNSAWAHQNHSRGTGIVTASGNSAAGVSAGARAGGTSAGIVTGAGAAAGSNGSGAVRAQGKGHVNP